MMRIKISHLTLIINILKSMTKGITRSRCSISRSRNRKITYIVNKRGSPFLRPRKTTSKIKDYFTGCTPWPQKGTASFINDVGNLGVTTTTTTLLVLPIPSVILLSLLMTRVRRVILFLLVKVKILLLTRIPNLVLCIMILVLMLMV